MAVGARRRTLEELLEAAQARIERLEPAEAFAATERGALLIDIRSDSDRERDGIVSRLAPHPAHGARMAARPRQPLAQPARRWPRPAAPAALRPRLLLRLRRRNPDRPWLRTRRRRNRRLRRLARRRTHHQARTAFPAPTWSASRNATTGSVGVSRTRDESRNPAMRWFLPRCAQPGTAWLSRPFGRRWRSPAAPVSLRANRGNLTTRHDSRMDALGRACVRMTFSRTIRLMGRSTGGHWRTTVLVPPACRAASDPTSYRRTSHVARPIDPEGAQLAALRLTRVGRLESGAARAAAAEANDAPDYRCDDPE